MRLDEPARLNVRFPISGESAAGRAMPCELRPSDVHGRRPGQRPVIHFVKTELTRTLVSAPAEERADKYRAERPVSDELPAVRAARFPGAAATFLGGRTQAFTLVPCSLSRLPAILKIAFRPWHAFTDVVPARRFWCHLAAGRASRAAKIGG